MKNIAKLKNDKRLKSESGRALLVKVHGVTPRYLLQLVGELVDADPNLGRMNDYELAGHYGVSRSMVNGRRSRLKIPANNDLDTKVVERESMVEKMSHDPELLTLTSNELERKWGARETWVAQARVLRERTEYRWMDELINRKWGRAV